MTRKSRLQKILSWKLPHATFSEDKKLEVWQKDVLKRIQTKRSGTQSYRDRLKI